LKSGQVGERDKCRVEQGGLYIVRAGSSPVAVMVAAAAARVSTSWRVVCVATTVRAVSFGHIDEVVLSVMNALCLKIFQKLLVPNKNPQKTQGNITETCFFLDTQDNHGSLQQQNHLRADSGSTHSEFGCIECKYRP